jgi:predicted PurR-regulated permease PerM
MTTNDRLRLGMALTAAFVVFWFAWTARAGLLPFIIGILLAYIIAPAVRFLATWVGRGDPDAPRARVLAILAVYLMTAGILTGLGFLIVPPVVDNVQELIDNQEQIIQDIRAEIDEWIAFYRREAPAGTQEWIDENLEEIQSAVQNWVASIAVRGANLIVSSIAAAIGFLVIPVWLFLALKDQHRFSAWFYGIFPVHLRGDVRYIARDTGRTFGSYLRSLLLLSVIVGVVTYIGLLLLDVPYAPALAVLAGVTELIPIIGPIIAAVITAGVVVAVDPGITVVWVLLFFVGVQQFENYILVPKIQGNALDVHPAVVIVLVLAAAEVFGLLGMALAAPLYAITRNAFVYIYRRLGGMPRPLAVTLETERRERDGDFLPVRDPEET